jgi:hypothetical protein
MRMILSAADSTRWASSPEGADAVEESVLRYAVAARIVEPVVVVTHDQQTAFAFCLGVEDEA